MCYVQLRVATVYPDAVTALVGREYLFKVEKATDHASRYDLSFKVKKICDDAAIINMFKTNEDIQTPTMVINHVVRVLYAIPVSILCFTYTEFAFVISS